MTPELEKIFSEYRPLKRKEYFEEWAKAFGDMLPKLEQETPEELSKALSNLSAEQLLKALPPERLEALLKLAAEKRDIKDN